MTDITKVPAVFAVIIIDDKICGTTRTDGTIGLPGGKADPGETVIETVIRESYEEGWDISKAKLIPYNRQNFADRDVTWVYVDGPVTMVKDHKEKHRGILPILVPIQEMIDSGRGNPEALKEAMERFKNKNQLIASEKELKRIAKNIMVIDHVAVQCDNIHDCEFKHQTILELDKLNKYEAIRLLMHVIHVQQLELAGAKIEYDKENPFIGMNEFNYISEYVHKCNSPYQETLY